MNVPPIQAVRAVVIEGESPKHAWTSEPTIDGRAAKCTWTSKPVGTTPSPPVDKEKKAVEHLSSAPDNKLLNDAEMTIESTPTSVTRMLCKRMFGVIPDASDPRYWLREGALSPIILNELPHYPVSYFGYRLISPTGLSISVSHLFSYCFAEELNSLRGLELIDVEFLGHR